MDCQSWDLSRLETKVAGVKLCARCADGYPVEFMTFLWSVWIKTGCVDAMSCVLCGGLDKVTLERVVEVRIYPDRNTQMWRETAGVVHVLSSIGFRTYLVN